MKGRHLKPDTSSSDSFPEEESSAPPDDDADAPWQPPTSESSRPRHRRQSVMMMSHAAEQDDFCVPLSQLKNRRPSLMPTLGDAQEDILGDINASMMESRDVERAYHSDASSESGGTQHPKNILERTRHGHKINIQTPEQRQQAIAKVKQSKPK